ncbi:hypothetical protein RCH19_000552 [Flavobacterium sp. PL12]|uniref:Uncharacterized protein n=1 Tax=Flavobacterium weaverense TaxID=271156 RepID=A0A3L9ZZC5_9FLAO|nr:hypothetical protein BC961_0144 [Flavobacterium weaverense]
MNLKWSFYINMKSDRIYLKTIMIYPRAALLKPVTVRLLSTDLT